jgi:hypothetical protein
MVLAKNRSTEHYKTEDPYSSPEAVGIWISTKMARAHVGSLFNKWC